jgi:calpain-15
MSDKSLTNTVILGNNMDVTDIDQGQLGDCYFLSACSAIAEKPERFVQAILTDSINSAGLFAMHAYVRGIAGTMVIDDYIPFDVYSWGAASPVFT